MSALAVLWMVMTVAMGSLLLVVIGVQQLRR